MITAMTDTPNVIRSLATPAFGSQAQDDRSPHSVPHYPIPLMKTPHILIVDDEPNIVMSLEFLMRKNGYQVGIARNGTEALAAIDQTPFDLILLDIMMPDVDGLQVCRQLRARPDRALPKSFSFRPKAAKPTCKKATRPGPTSTSPSPSAPAS